MSRKRILVLIRGHVSDLVSAFPALRELRAARPDAHIAVMVNEYVRDALDHCPYVDEVLVGFMYNKRTRVARLVHTAGLFLRTLGRFDVVLGLHNSPRTTPILALLTGASERLAFADEGPLKLLLSRDLGPEPPLPSLRVRNLQIVEATGIKGSPAYSPMDWFPASVQESVRRTLSELGVPEGARFATLQMSCSWGCNEWADHKWAELADFLNHELGLICVSTGTDEASELAKFDRVQSLMRSRLVSMHGKTSLPQLFELVRLASLGVASDSALTQVILVQQTPGVVMFGIEPMSVNGPLPDEWDRFEAVQYWEGPDKEPPPNPLCVLAGNGPPVSYCHGVNCRENSSMERVTVAEIKERVLRVLAQPAQSDTLPRA